MQYIHTIDLANRSTLPKIKGIVRAGGCLELAPGVDEGTLLTPVFNPTLVTQWLGLDVLPDEAGVGVCIQKPNPDEEYYHFSEGTWRSLPTPIYQSPETIRQGLSSWIGGMRVAIKLVRAGLKSPQVCAIGFGYDIPDGIQPLDYAIKFALPSLLLEEIALSRQVEADGRSVNLPVGLNPVRILKPQVYVPTTKQLLAGAVKADYIAVEQAIPAGLVYLLFNYVPSIAQEQPPLTQIEEVPSIVIRLLNRERERKVPTAEDWVRLPDNRSIVWHGERVYNSPIELNVVAASSQEARTIAEKCIARIDRTGYLEMPPWGTLLPIRVHRGIRMGVGEMGSTLSRGTLSTVNFRVMLLNLPEGAWTEERSLVATVQAPEVFPH